MVCKSNANLIVYLCKTLGGYTMENEIPVLQAIGVRKSFSGNTVLKDINFTINKGEIHALLGHNGAGKSTLVKILLGIYTRDDGEILINSQKENIANPEDARNSGLAIVHQELNLFPNLSIAENMYLGREITYTKQMRENKTFMGMVQAINRKEMITNSKEYLARVGLEIDPREPVSSLSMGQRQLLEIAKGLSENANILILDEPTSSLSPHETKNLFKILRTLSNEGVTTIFISHRLDEVFEICDKITVLRDGKLVDTVDTESTNEEEVIEKMVGSRVGQLYGGNRVINESSGKPVLRINNLHLDGQYTDISIDIHKGEIVGLAGLVGAGRTEVLESIFGLRSFEDGDLYYLGKNRRFLNPSEAVNAGIGFVPEDRRDQGLFLQMNVGRNMSMATLKELSTAGRVNRKEERALVNKYIDELNIRTTGFYQPITQLSGGNQQKVVLSKWFAKGINLLLLDEPTRGVDVKSKAEIYTLVNDFLESGGSILMASSELAEVIGMSDRIITFRRGRITGEIAAQDASENKVMEMIV